MLLVLALAFPAVRLLIVLLYTLAGSVCHKSMIPRTTPTTSVATFASVHGMICIARSSTGPESPASMLRGCCSARCARHVLDTAIAVYVFYIRYTPVAAVQSPIHIYIYIPVPLSMYIYM